MNGIITVEQAANASLNRKLRRKYGIKGQPTKQTSAHVHKKVKEVAEGIAHVLYDEMMKNNAVYAKFKSQHEGLSARDLEARFVAHLWPQLIPQARATLAAMLRGPYTDAMKDEILDVLVKDQSLVRGRQSPEQVLGSLATKA